MILLSTTDKTQLRYKSTTKTLRKKIQQELAKNSIAQNIIKNIADNTYFKIRERILLL